ncbi:MAG: hypothetical protein Q8886_02730, partial [Candidatus Phytoplasma australasiaticum]|nr:hypothetical protein [Candidatus Phytoplasma australasiaticum]
MGWVVVVRDRSSRRPASVDLLEDGEDGHVEGDDHAADEHADARDEQRLDDRRYYAHFVVVFSKDYYDNFDLLNVFGKDL